VEWDDEGLEDEPASPLLPPDDRLWRHPSEAAGAAGAPGAAPTAVRGTAGPVGSVATGTRVVTAVALTSCISVLLTIGIVAALRPFPMGTGHEDADGPAAAEPIASNEAEPDVADLTARLRPAIAQVIARTAAGERSWGSGVLVRADGLILTSHDVVAGAAAVRVVLDDGRDFVARLLGSDADTGVAVLDIDGDDYPTAPMADAAGGAVEVGDRAITIGSSRGTTATEPLVRVSMVSAMHQDAGAEGHHFVDVIRTDAPVEPGCAGGAVVDGTGRVVGIAVDNVETADGAIGFATPIDVARSVAEQLERDGRVVRAWLGVDGEPHEDGALVRSVKPTSPAEAAGVQAGDVIVALDGAAVASMSAVIVQMRSHRPGDVVRLGLQRGDDRLEVPVTLAEKPATSG
jgi:S1-C subfamily serine protease